MKNFSEISKKKKFKKAVSSKVFWMLKEERHILLKKWVKYLLTHVGEFSYPVVQIQSHLILPLVGMSVKTQPICWFLPVSLVPRWAREPP